MPSAERLHRSGDILSVGASVGCGAERLHPAVGCFLLLRIGQHHQRERPLKRFVISAEARQRQQRRCLLARRARVGAMVQGADHERLDRRRIAWLALLPGLHIPGAERLHRTGDLPSVA